MSRSPRARLSIRAAGRRSSTRRSTGARGESNPARPPRQDPTALSTPPPLTAARLFDRPARRLSLGLKPGDRPPLKYSAKHTAEVRRAGSGSIFPLLDWSRRKEGAADVVMKLPAALEEEGPRTVWLAENDLGPSAGAPLGSALSACAVRVTRLTLTGCGLGDAGFAALLGALTAEAASSLRCLALGVNNLTESSGVLLGGALSPGGALLGMSELMVGGNAIGRGGALAIAAALAAVDAAGQGTSNLASLQMGGTQATDEGAAAVAAALTTPGGRLRLLHLNNAGAGPKAAAAFGAALGAEGCGLVELWLGGNPLGAPGVRALISGLGRCARLEKLWLDLLPDLAVGDEAMAPLAAAISADASALSELWLGGNKAIGDAGARALAAALPKARALRKLWLDHTSISPEGALELVEAACGADVGLAHLWLGGKSRAATPSKSLTNDDLAQLADLADELSASRAAGPLKVTRSAEERPDPLVGRGLRGGA